MTINYNSDLYKYSDYVINAYEKKHHTQITLERLQKLLFISEIYSLVNNDERIFDSDFVIGKYGPILEQLDIHYNDVICIHPIYKEIRPIPPQTKKCIDYVMFACSNVETLQLIENCTLPDSPWKIDRGEYINKWGFKIGDVIPLNILKRYYTNYHFKDKNELTHYGELFNQGLK